MSRSLSLLCVLAHPDDESLGTGGLLAKCATEGIPTYLVTATRGERGRVGEERPGPKVAGPIREAELRAAARELAIQEVRFLDYEDGALDRADPGEAIGKIAVHLRAFRPDVVVTFGPEGAYGHPDHIAIGQLTTAAVVCAADPTYGPPGHRGSAHRVAKLYYLAWSEAKWASYQSALRKLTYTIDGAERQANPYPDWMITTVLDTTEVWPTVWRAVSCHQSQMSIYKKLVGLPKTHHHALWGSQELYRVFSTVNGGRAQETDLFEGLR